METPETNSGYGIQKRGHKMTLKQQYLSFFLIFPQCHGLGLFFCSDSRLLWTICLSL